MDPQSIADLALFSTNAIAEQIVQWLAQTSINKLRRQPLRDSARNLRLLFADAAAECLDLRKGDFRDQVAARVTTRAVSYWLQHPERCWLTPQVAEVLAGARNPSTAQLEQFRERAPRIYDLLLERLDDNPRAAFEFNIEKLRLNVALKHGLIPLEAYLPRDSLTPLKDRDFLTISDFSKGAFSIDREMRVPPMDSGVAAVFHGRPGSGKSSLLATFVYQLCLTGYDGYVINPKHGGVSDTVGQLHVYDAPPGGHVLLIDDAHLVADSALRALTAICSEVFLFTRTSGLEGVQGALSSSEAIRLDEPERLVGVARAIARTSGWIAPPEQVDLCFNDFGQDLALWKWALAHREGTETPDSGAAKRAAERYYLGHEHVPARAALLHLAAQCSQYEIELPRAATDKLEGIEVERAVQALLDEGELVAVESGTALRHGRHPSVCRILARRIPAKARHILANLSARISDSDVDAELSSGRVGLRLAVAAHRDPALCARKIHDSLTFLVEGERLLTVLGDALSAATDALPASPALVKARVAAFAAGGYRRAGDVNRALVALGPYVQDVGAVSAQCGTSSHVMYELAYVYHMMDQYEAAIETFERSRQFAEDWATQAMADTAACGTRIRMLIRELRVSDRQDVGKLLLRDVDELLGHFESRSEGGFAVRRFHASLLDHAAHLRALLGVDLAAADAAIRRANGIRDEIGRKPDPRTRLIAGAVAAAHGAWTDAIALFTSLQPVLLGRELEAELALGLAQARIAEAGIGSIVDSIDDIKAVALRVDRHTADGSVVAYARACLEQLELTAGMYALHGGARIDVLGNAA